MLYFAKNIAFSVLLKKQIYGLTGKIFRSILTYKFYVSKHDMKWAVILSSSFTLRMAQTAWAQS